MKIVKDIAKNILNKGKVHVYHNAQNKEANRMLRLVESEKGTLDFENKKLCTEYALDIFGHKKYAPWLMVYSAYAKKFKEGWIPDNFYGEVVVPALKGDYGQVCNRTSIIGKLLEDKYTSDIGYFINNLFLTTNSEILDSEKFKNLLFRNNNRVVYKVENSLQGKGIYFLDQKSFDSRFIGKLGNGVFQSYIKQHPFFNQFNNSSVATIRLTSVCTNEGHIEVRAGYFRFGRGADTHVMSSRQMRIPIDIVNGTLLDVAFFPKSESTKNLPDNDIAFGGIKLPFFENCISEIKRMHGIIPFIRCIGWDIIVDENENLRIIELNGGHNAITFSEMVQGPCFKGLGWEKLNQKH